MWETRKKLLTPGFLSDQLQGLQPLGDANSFHLFQGMEVLLHDSVRIKNVKLVVSK